MFDVLGVRYVDAVNVGESIGAWSGDLLDKVGPFLVRGEFMESGGALLSSENEVADREGPRFDVPVVVTA